MQRVLYAPNIHQGGGRSILLPLLEAVRNDASLWLLLDERMQLPNGLQLKGKVIRVIPSISGRLAAEWWLMRHLPVHSTVLAMGNLPPLLVHASNLWIFIQNRYLIDSSPCWDGLSWKVRFRLKIERLWLRLRLQQVAHLLVQTPTMQAILHSGLHRDAVVMPFMAVKAPEMRGGVGEMVYDFLYVASGESHKNHRNLVEAWVLLAQQQRFPSLALTLDKTRFPDLCRWVEQRSAEHRLNIALLGECAADHIHRLYAASRALIYPSRYESFGLPLLEAVVAGLPVLAADEPYVTDVVAPTAVFDAVNPQSIAESVSGFSFSPSRITIGLMSADEFLQQTIYSESV